MATNNTDRSWKYASKSSLCVGKHGSFCFVLIKAATYDIVRSRDIPKIKWNLDKS